MATTYQLKRVGTVLSLKDVAYSTIKEAILSFELEPGTPLVEHELAEQLGVSKTPVRDALQELEREGFVVRIPFKGTYVTHVTMTDMAEIFQLRAVLEGLAARLAAPHFSPLELQQISDNHAAAAAALGEGDLAACSEWGKRLHDAIINKAETHNQRLVQIIRNLDDHVVRLRILSDRVQGRLHRSVPEHRRIVEALHRGDPMAAEQAMRTHLSSVLQDLSVPEEEPGPAPGA
jgi:DNA-binding GntR family transcriptional regulator